jgi:predicted phage terminase large subunit-like protein
MKAAARLRRAARRASVNAKLPPAQPGPQSQFVNTPADIAIYGGAAGCGKSGGLLLGAAQAVDNPNYGAVIFRRNFTQITEEGALWDTSQELYGGTGAIAKVGSLDWIFPSGAKVGFAHMDNDQTRFSYQGAQIAYIGFDELTHFSATVFWYMLSRNRSTSGVQPKVRATCNPEAESWVAELIAWWIDDDGYAIADRSGVIRYFVRMPDGSLLWGDTPDDLVARGIDRNDVYSFTFIRGRLKDNPALMERDPKYRARLKLLHPVDRERLLGDEEKGGNWRVKLEAGKVFDRTWFVTVPCAPIGGQEIRYWDLAATAAEVAKSTHFYTAGVKLKIVGGVTYILDMIAEQRGPAQVDTLIMATAQQDGDRCWVRWEKEGGSAGILHATALAEKLRGYNAKGCSPTGDKVARATPVATEAAAGQVYLVAGPWNDRFLSALQQFDGSAKPLTNDITDALSGGYAEAKQHGGIQSAPRPNPAAVTPKSLRKIF